MDKVPAGELEEVIVPDRHSLTYGSYLKVEELLSLQKLASFPEEHDEMLFIVIHQAYELWFKQILHELSLCERALACDQTMVFLRAAKRIATIQGVLVHQIDILETMTPTDFNRFRDKLNPASGFQSFQFRLLEIRLGAKQKGYLKFYRHDDKIYDLLVSALQKPSLYDIFLQHLARKGIPIPERIVGRDTGVQHEANHEVTDCLLKIYRDPANYYELYMACEQLIDIDEGMLLWRYRHIAMVERMIGRLKGTGGSSGVDYLSQTLKLRFFPEIWDVRNKLGLKMDSQVY